MTPPNKLSQTRGLPPGTPVYTGNKTLHSSLMELYCYDETGFEIVECSTWAELKPKINLGKTNWINIDSISNTKLVEEVSNHFVFHALLLEDIVTVGMLPKFDEYDDHLLFSIKMLSLGKEGDKDHVHKEQISFVLGRGYLISFQEDEGDVFNVIRERITQNKGRVRRKKADYLMLTLIDVIVDNYLQVLDDLQTRIQHLEEELLSKRIEHTERKILKLRNQIVSLRKSIFPLRESMRQLLRDESDLIEEINMKYYRDVFDHLNYTCESLDGFKDNISGLLDLYSSNLNNRLNNIIKVLTIVSSIFIPLTFIAGIYGMNFDYMPELRYHYGYPIVMGVMALIGFLMFVFMWRKKWL
jgi:magnesium transporter